MLVCHFKNHSPTPQKYVRVKLATVSAHNSFHLKLLANVRNCWQRLREWNAPQFSVALSLKWPPNLEMYGDRS